MCSSCLPARWPWFPLADFVSAPDQFGMLEPRRSSVQRQIAALLVALLVALGTCPRAGEAPPPPRTGELTFFGWSDQHVQASGEGAHLHAAIDAMNALPGTPYPDRFGGKVSEPAFVFGCGDITEWPSAAARDTYTESITRRLKWPSFDILGNHDEGGDARVETMKQWLVRRHGALSYTFDRAGIHFIALFSAYDESLKNPAQALSREALSFLAQDLKRRPAGTPVVVAMHLCLDALTNRDQFIDTLGEANVVLILGGHYHKAQVDQYRNRTFVQLPSPAPNGQREFMVVRFQAGRLLALPYNYGAQQWVTEPRKMLDVSLASLLPLLRQGRMGVGAVADDAVDVRQDVLFEERPVIRPVRRHKGVVLKLAEDQLWNGADDQAVERRGTRFETGELIVASRQKPHGFLDARLRCIMTQQPPARGIVAHFLPRIDHGARLDRFDDHFQRADTLDG